MHALRPKHEDAAFEVRVSMAFGRDALRGEEREGHLHARFCVPIRPGATLASRTPLVIDVAHAPALQSALTLSDLTPLGHCEGEGCAVPLVALDDEAVSRYGLAPPPRPASLGTRASSAAKRPWWSSPQGTHLPEIATDRQKADADTELALCTFSDRVEDPSVLVDGNAMPTSEDSGVSPCLWLISGQARA